MVGRSFVLVLVAVSVAWIPIITRFNSSQLFIYIQVSQTKFIRAIIFARKNTICFEHKYFKKTLLNFCSLNLELLMRGG